MDKNAIKKYAVWARRELISRVSQKALQYGISEKETVPASAASINGVVLSAAEIKQRKALIDQINAKGYEQVMEEVAYTWFNRFIALRFMEVNGYLPSHVRVFTDEDNAFKPQIITEAINLEMDGLDMDKVYAWKDANDNDSLFKYLIITQCNALSPILPRMFQRIADYTELLFPDNLLREGSAIQQMIEMIPEDDWKDAVQIIGWLYQYYNSEKKDEVFAALKKNVKITKENIPAATQLFTPDWIVRYMVENSLGRLWVEGHPNDSLKAQWKYYLDEAEQEPDVQAQLATIRKEYASMTPEEIKCIDPSAGSGHILVYMFDVLVQIYEDYGYSAREAVRGIVDSNLYGLDIDERAAQLAYFAVMMKARQYDRRFLARKDEDGNPDVPQPHIYAIVESNDIDRFALDYFTNGDASLKKAMDGIVREMQDAKEYGSILKITPVDFSALYSRLDEVRDDIDMSKSIVMDSILPLVQIAEVLAQKYDVVITNPPYLGNGSIKLTEYLQQNYAVEKYDLYSAFMRKGLSMLKGSGFEAMVTGDSWMFLPSFSEMRKSLVHNTHTINMAHLGFGAFDGGFGTTSFVIRGTKLENYRSSFIRLVSYKDGSEKAEMLASNKKKPIFFQQKDFEKIEGFPFAYWMNKNVLDSFQNSPLSQHAVTKAGIVTGNNDYFMKFWHEISFPEIVFDASSDDSELPKWVPAHKGGGNCRYYGNLDYVMRLNDLWNPSLATGNMRRGDQDFYFLEGLTWSTLSNKLAFRFSPKGFVYETKGSMCFPKGGTNIYFMLGLVNSSLCEYVMNILSPTLDFNRGSLLKMPYVEDSEISRTVEDNVQSCIAIAREDWDSFETSWDFKRHPLI